jgi:hypothetical protein
MAHIACKLAKQREKTAILVRSWKLA